MRETAINVAVAACLCACEVFLLSLGWNLSRSLFDQREMTITQAVGAILVLKIVSVHIYPRPKSC